MSNNQYLSSSAETRRDWIVVRVQTADSYAALVATAGPEHGGRSSYAGSPSSSGSFSSLSLHALKEQSFQRIHPGLERRATVARTYGSPDCTGVMGFAPVYSTPTRKTYASPTGDFGFNRTVGRVPAGSDTYHANLAHGHQEPHASTLSGVPESVSVQEMAFRQGQQDSSSPFTDTPASPFTRQFDQLWKAFYLLGKEYGSQRTPTPVNHFQQNFDWPVLINPYTQSLKNPRGSLDPAWSRKMIEAALNCMEELVRITCRRNVGWDKTVADIPLPAQQALVAFPDLAQCYEHLKRAAQQARAGGRPAGF